MSRMWAAFLWAYHSEGDGVDIDTISVGGDAMSVYEALMIMLTFGLVVAAIVADKKTKK